MFCPCAPVGLHIFSEGVGPSDSVSLKCGIYVFCFPSYLYSFGCIVAGIYIFWIIIICLCIFIGVLSACTWFCAYFVVLTIIKKMFLGLRCSSECLSSMCKALGLISNTETNKPYNLNFYVSFVLVTGTICDILIILTVKISLSYWGGVL